ncbi:MAG TPA: dienelactone hydrolase family protein [Armatimonadota bacterium]|jgi:dienelactone hydrolase
MSDLPTGPAGDLYEEELTASLPHREAQWQELEAYTERVVAEGAAREVYPADFSSEAAYLRTIEPLRELLRERIGYPPPGLGAAGEARLELVGEDRLARYYRAWIPLATAAGELHVYGLYLVPQGLTGPAPLVLAQHGGGGTPEATIFAGGANYKDMTRGAAARGYVVFAPGLLFNPFSDLEVESLLPADARRRLDQRLRLVGTSLTALEVAKLSRALDALLVRPEVDAERVAMVGLSYGGYYTLYATALEPRIRVAVSSCYFNDQAQRMAAEFPQNWSDMRFAGTVSELADPELAALICPRPLQVQVGEEDTLFNIDAARQAAQRAGEYYQRLGAEERWDFQACAGGHEWFGEEAWGFLERWL